MASTGYTTSLAAAAATGAGTAIDVVRSLEEANNLGLFVSTTGTPASFAIQVEVSCDLGTTYYALGSTITAAGASVATLPPGTNKVRLNLTTLTGGTAPTVTGRLAFNVEA